MLGGSFIVGPTHPTFPGPWSYNFLTIAPHEVSLVNLVQFAYSPLNIYDKNSSKYTSVIKIVVVHFSEHCALPLSAYAATYASQAETISKDFLAMSRSKNDKKLYLQFHC